MQFRTKENGDRESYFSGDNETLINEMYKGNIRPVLSYGGKNLDYRVFAGKTTGGGSLKLMLNSAYEALEQEDAARGLPSMLNFFNELGQNGILINPKTGKEFENTEAANAAYAKWFDARNKILSHSVPIESLGGKTPTAALVNLDAAYSAMNMPKNNRFDGGGFIDPDVYTQDFQARMGPAKFLAQRFDWKQWFKDTGYAYQGGEYEGDKDYHFFMPGMTTSADDYKKYRAALQSGLGLGATSFTMDGKKVDFGGQTFKDWRDQRFVDVMSDDYKAVLFDTTLKSTAKLSSVTPEQYQRIVAATSGKEGTSFTADQMMQVKNGMVPLSTKQQTELFGMMADPEYGFGLRLMKDTENYAGKKDFWSPAFMSAVMMTPALMRQSQENYEKAFQELSTPEGIIKRMFSGNDIDSLRVQRDPSLIYRDKFIQQSVQAEINDLEDKQMRGYAYMPGSAQMLLATANPTFLAAIGKDMTGKELSGIAAELAVGEHGVIAPTVSQEGTINWTRSPYAPGASFFASPYARTAANRYRLSQNSAMFNVEDFYTLNTGDFDGDFVWAYQTLKNDEDFKQRTEERNRRVQELAAKREAEEERIKAQDEAINGKQDRTVEHDVTGFGTATLRTNNTLGPIGLGYKEGQAWRQIEATPEELAQIDDYANNTYAKGIDMVKHTDVKVAQALGIAREAMSTRQPIERMTDALLSEKETGSFGATDIFKYGLPTYIDPIGTSILSGAAAGRRANVNYGERIKTAIRDNIEHRYVGAYQEERDLADWYGNLLGGKLSGEFQISTLQDLSEGRTKLSALGARIKAISDKNPQAEELKDMQDLYRHAENALKLEETLGYNEGNIESIRRYNAAMHWDNPVEKYGFKTKSEQDAATILYEREQAARYAEAQQSRKNEIAQVISEQTGKVPGSVDEGYLADRLMAAHMFTGFNWSNAKNWMSGTLRANGAMYGGLRQEDGITSTVDVDYNAAVEEANRLRYTHGQGMSRKEQVARQILTGESFTDADAIVGLAAHAYMDAYGSARALSERNSKGEFRTSAEEAANIAYKAFEDELLGKNGVLSDEQKKARKDAGDITFGKREDGSLYASYEGVAENQLSKTQTETLARINNKLNLASRNEYTNQGSLDKVAADFYEEAFQRKAGDHMIMTEGTPFELGDDGQLHQVAIRRREGHNGIWMKPTREGREVIDFERYSKNASGHTVVSNAGMYFTPDMIKKDDNGNITIVDWKSSQHGQKDALFQMGFYAHQLEQLGRQYHETGDESLKWYGQFVDKDTGRSRVTGLQAVNMFGKKGEEVLSYKYTQEWGDQVSKSVEGGMQALAEDAKKGFYSVIKEDIGVRTNGRQVGGSRPTVAPEVREEDAHFSNLEEAGLIGRLLSPLQKSDEVAAGRTGIKDAEGHYIDQDKSYLVAKYMKDKEELDEINAFANKQNRYLNNRSFEQLDPFTRNIDSLRQKFTEDQYATLQKYMRTTDDSVYLQHAPDLDLMSKDFSETQHEALQTTMRLMGLRRQYVQQLDSSMGLDYNNILYGEGDELSKLRSGTAKYQRDLSALEAVRAESTLYNAKTGRFKTREELDAEIEARRDNESEDQYNARVEKARKENEELAIESKRLQTKYDTQEKSIREAFGTFEGGWIENFKKSAEYLNSGLGSLFKDGSIDTAVTGLQTRVRDYTREADTKLPDDRYLHGTDEREAIASLVTRLQDRAKEFEGLKGSELESLLGYGKQFDAAKLNAIKTGTQISQEDIRNKAMYDFASMYVRANPNATAQELMESVNTYGQTYNAQHKNQEDLQNLQQQNQLTAIRDQNEVRNQQLERQFAQANRQQRMRYSTSRIANAIYGVQQRRDAAETQYENINRQVAAEQRTQAELKMRMDNAAPGSEDYKKAAAAYVQSEERLKGLTQAAGTAREQLKQLNSAGTMSNAVFGAFSQSVNMLLTRFGRQLFQKALTEAKKFVQEFDKTMTSIQMITLKSDEQMSTLGDSLIAKAKELKISVAEITQSAETLYRQGLSDEEVDERLDVISKFSKVSGTKVDAATKLITVAMNTGLVTDPRIAADVVTALGDNAATNASEIEKGIEKAGAAAAADGTTFAQLASMLTAITSTTQIGGNVAGRTLNTIFGRMNKIGTNELIYDENGNAISGSDVSKLLAAQGIRTYDEKGNKRSSYDVLYDLSQVWDSLEDATQQQLASQIAGTRQYSNFAAIMQGMSEGKVSEYMSLSENAEGITDQKYEIYTKSLQASLTDLKNTFDALVEDLVDKGYVQDFISGITTMINGVDNLVNALGGLQMALPLVMTLVGALNGLKFGGVGALVGAAIGLGSYAGLTALGQGDNNVDFEQIAIDGHKKQTETARSNLEKAQNMYESYKNGRLSEEEVSTFDKLLSDIDVSISGAFSEAERAAIGLSGTFENVSDKLDAYAAAIEAKVKKETEQEFRKYTSVDLSDLIASRYENGDGRTYTEDEKAFYDYITEHYADDGTIGWGHNGVEDYVRDIVSRGLSSDGSVSPGYFLDVYRDRINEWVKQGKFIQAYKREGDEYTPIPYTDIQDLYRDLATYDFVDENGVETQAGSNVKKLFELIMTSGGDAGFNENMESQEAFARDIVSTTYGERLKTSLSKLGYVDDNLASLVTDAYIDSVMQGVRGQIIESNAIGGEPDIPGAIADESKRLFGNMYDFLQADNPLNAFQNYVIESKKQDTEFLEEHAEELKGLNDEGMSAAIRGILFPTVPALKEEEVQEIAQDVLHAGAATGYSTWSTDKSNAYGLAADAMLRNFESAGVSDAVSLRAYLQTTDGRDWKYLTQNNGELAQLVNSIQYDEDGNIINPDVYNQIIDTLYANSKARGARFVPEQEKAEKAQSMLTSIAEGEVGYLSWDDALAAAEAEEQANRDTYEASIQEALTRTREKYKETQSPEELEKGMARYEELYRENNPYTGQTAEQIAAGYRIYTADEQKYLKETVGGELYDRLTGKNGQTASIEEQAYAQTLVNNKRYGISGLTSRQQLEGMHDVQRIISEGSLANYSEPVANAYMAQFAGWGEYSSLIKRQQAGEILSPEEQKQLETLQQNFDNIVQSAQIKVDIEGVQQLESAGKVAEGTAAAIEKLKKGGKIALEVSIDARNKAFSSGQTRAKLANGTVAEQDEAIMALTGVSREQLYATDTSRAEYMRIAAREERLSREQEIDSIWRQYQEADPLSKIHYRKAAEDLGYTIGVEGYTYTGVPENAHASSLAGTQRNYTDVELAEARSNLLNGTLTKDSNYDLYSAAVSGLGTYGYQVQYNKENGIESSDELVRLAKQEAEQAAIMAREQETLEKARLGATTSGGALSYANLGYQQGNKAALAANDIYRGLTSGGIETVEDLSEAVNSQDVQNWKDLLESSEDVRKAFEQVGARVDKDGTIDLSGVEDAGYNAASALDVLTAAVAGASDAYKDQKKIYSVGEKYAQAEAFLRGEGDFSTGYDAYSEIIGNPELAQIAYNNRREYDEQLKLYNDQQNTLNSLPLQARIATKARLRDNGELIYKPTLDIYGGINSEIERRYIERKWDRAKYGNTELTDVERYEGLQDILAASKYGEIRNLGKIGAFDEYTQGIEGASDWFRATEILQENGLSWDDLKTNAEKYDVVSNSLNEIYGNYKLALEANENFEDAIAETGRKLKVSGDYLDAFSIGLKRNSSNIKENNAANKSWNETISTVLKNQKIRQDYIKYKTKAAEVASMVGLSKEDVLKKNNQQDVEEQLKAQEQEDLETVNSMLEGYQADLIKEAQEYMSGNNYEITPEVEIDIKTNGYTVVSESDLAGIVGEKVAADMKATAAAMNGQGVETEYQLSYDANGAPQIKVVAKTLGEGRGGGGGGGGGGKSPLDTLLEEQKYEISDIQHRVNMNDIETTHAGRMNSDDEYLAGIQKDIALRQEWVNILDKQEAKILEYIKTVKKGSEDEKKAYQALWSVQEERAKKNDEMIDSLKKETDYKLKQQDYEDYKRDTEYSFIDTYAQAAMSQNRFSDYEAYSLAKQENLRGQIDANLLQEQEVIAEMAKYEEDSDEYRESYKKLLEIRMDSATKENQMIEEEQNLIRERINQIAKTLQYNDMTNTSFENRASIMANVYQSGGYMDQYREALNKQIGYKQNSLENTTKARNDAMAEVERIRTNPSLYGAIAYPYYSEQGIGSAASGNTSYGIAAYQFDSEKGIGSAVSSDTPVPVGHPNVDVYYEAVQAVYTYDEGIVQTTADLEELKTALTEADIKEINDNLTDATMALEAKRNQTKGLMEEAKELRDYDNYNKLALQSVEENEKLANEKRDAAGRILALIQSGRLTPEQLRQQTQQYYSLMGESEDLDRESRRQKRENQREINSQVLEDINQRSESYNHNMNLVQYEQTRYQNSGEITNLNKMIGQENDLRQDRSKQIENDIKLVKDQIEATKDDAEETERLTKKLKELEEEEIKNNNEIEKNNKVIKENIQKIRQLQIAVEKTVDSEIEKQKKTQRDMLNSRVNMENQILDVIRKNEQEKWNLTRKSLEEERKALNERKKNIDEEMNYKRKMLDQENKYEELAELQKQLALIEADPTRSKDARELRKRIEDLNKEISMTKYEDEAQAEKERIDEELEGIAKYEEKGEKDLQDRLADANNFREQIYNLLESDNKQGFVDFMKEINSSYKNATEAQRKQMEQGWDDTWKTMKHILENNGKEIAKILKSEDSYLNFMMGSDEYLNAENDNKRNSLIYNWSKAYEDWQAGIKDTAELVDLHDHRIANGNGEMNNIIDEAYDTNVNGKSRKAPEFQEGVKYDTQYQNDVVSYLQDIVEIMKAPAGKAKEVVPENADESAAQPESEGPGGNSGSPSNSTKYAYQVHGINPQNEKTVFGTNYNSETDARAAMQKALKQRWTNLDIDKIKKFASGGLVDYTGLAWVDGTKFKPEAFLSTVDVENIRALTKALSFVTVPSFNLPNLDSFNGNSQTVGDINITINQAELKSDADYEEVARKVGQAFTKQLSKEGFNLRSYAF